MGSLRCLLLLYIFTFLVFSSNSTSPDEEEAQAALLAFKSGADLNNFLIYSANLSCCTWKGVKCFNGTVIKYEVQYSRLEGLISLSLANNNFTGTLPVELLGLTKLLSLNLSSNHFSGSFPPLNQTYLKVLDVSDNNISGMFNYNDMFVKGSFGSLDNHYR
ncbi:putative inactive receptor kinase, partial [Trifolium medium]|nr:putative inactive receptor kinase [Trifolium medium]